MRAIRSSSDGHTYRNGAVNSRKAPKRGDAILDHEAATGGEVAGGVLDRVDALAAGRAAELGEHVDRQVDPRHVETSTGERKRYPAGADGELEHPPTVGEFCEAVDRSVSRPASRTQTSSARGSP